jgi:hypothetical protein
VFSGADRPWQQIIFRSRLSAETVGFLEQRDFGKVCFLGAENSSKPVFPQITLLLKTYRFCKYPAPVNVPFLQGIYC